MQKKDEIATYILSIRYKHVIIFAVKFVAGEQFWIKSNLFGQKP